MQRAEIIEKIREALVRVLKHDRFEMTDTLQASDVDGWDSLSHMMIISEVEKTFNTRFKLKELNKLKNMGDLITLVESRQ